MFLGVTGTLLAMHTERERQAIARAVTAARTELGLSKESAAREGGISSITWKRVEDGLNVQDTKLRAIEKVLGWEDGHVDRIAGGEPAIESGHFETPEGRTVYQYRSLPGGMSQMTEAIELGQLIDMAIVMVGRMREGTATDAELEQVSTTLSRARDLTQRAVARAVRESVDADDLSFADMLIASTHVDDSATAFREQALDAGRRITQSDYVLAQRAGETEYEIRQKTEPQAEDENQDNGSDEPA